MAALATKTTTTLLEGLDDPANQTVWWEFDAHYRRVLFSFARRLGLADEDAADVVQETLLRFVRSYWAGKYERDRARLSSWILGIARNCILEQQRARAARRAARGTSAVVDLPDFDELTEAWEAERTREILCQAMRTLHEETRIDAQTIRAFELLAFQQLSPSEVAAELGVTLNDVYLAKHRCLKRLRAIVAALEVAYDAGQ